VNGKVIAGRYRITSQLGAGGMGSVWRAEHLTLGSPVVIKLIDEAIAKNPEILARFEREAQAAASLRSPHVVQVLDYGVDDKTPFIAMELLDGESLEERRRWLQALQHSAALAPAQGQCVCVCVCVCVRARA
jgi:serine/threonine-protein kinase